MTWIATGLVVWLVFTAFFLCVWHFAFRRGREQGRIEGGQLAYWQGRNDERRDQAFEPLVSDNATLASIVCAQSGLGGSVGLTTGDGSPDKPFRRSQHAARCSSFRPGGECDCVARIAELPRREGHRREQSDRIVAS